MKVKVSDNFYLHEFIDKKTYEKYGVKSIWFLDMRIVQIAQLLRELIDAPITINSWYDGGQYHLSGLRPPGTAVGASMSQHRFGRAVDIKVKGKTPKQAYKIIKDNKDRFMQLGLSTVEDLKVTPTWLHLDCRETGLPDLKIVKP